MVRLKVKQRADSTAGTAAKVFAQMQQPAAVIDARTLLLPEFPSCLAVTSTAFVLGLARVLL